MPELRRRPERRTNASHYWLMVMIGGAIFGLTMMTWGVAQAAGLHSASCAALSQLLSPTIIFAISGGIVSVIGAIGSAASLIIKSTRTADTPTLPPTLPPTVK